MAWYNGSWAYRKSVVISNAVADYQSKILVGESSGATGEEVDCGGKCKTDFSDLRFTGADGITLLPYWIESITGTTPNQLATIQVKNDATPSATGYMYYGNAAASAVSSGADTFIFFDDFPGVAIDTGKWYPSGDVSVASSICTIGTTNASFIYCLTAFGQNIRYRERIKTSVIVAASSQVSEIGVDGNNYAVVLAQTGLNYYTYDTKAAASSYVDTGVALDTANYHIWELIRNGTASIKHLYDDVLKVTEITNVFTADGNITPSVNALGVLLIDWIFVSKYAATEPTWGSWGAEVTNTVHPLLTLGVGD